MPSPVTLFQWISDGGVIALLLVAVAALQQRWIVPGEEIRAREKRIAQLERELEIYRDLALRNAGSQQIQAGAVQQIAEAIEAVVKNARPQLAP